MSEDLPVEADADGRERTGWGPLIVALLAYTAVRLALVVVIAVIIFFGGQLVGVDVPPLVAAVFGVLIALPLGMVLFKNLRVRVNTEIARVDAERQAQRDDIASRLRGE